MFDSQKNQFLGADANGAQAQPLDTSTKSWFQILSGQQDSNSQGSGQTTAPSLADDALTRDWKNTLKNNYRASLTSGDPLDGVARAKLANTQQASGATSSPNINGNVNQQNNEQTADASTMRADLGDSVKQFESGSRGVDTVSTGKNDRGGVSYGTYQLSSTKGTARRFLDSPEGAQYKDYFTGLEPGTADFTTKWKELAANDPEGMHKAEKSFIYRTHYQPVVDAVKDYGLDMKNPAIQDAIWSGAIQHGAGGFTKILQKAYDSGLFKSGVAQDHIEAIYKAREDFTNKIKDFNPVAGSLRYAKEKPVLINLNNSYRESQKTNR